MPCLFGLYLELSSPKQQKAARIQVMASKLHPNVSLEIIYKFSWQKIFVGLFSSKYFSEVFTKKYFQEDHFREIFSEGYFLWSVLVSYR